MQYITEFSFNTETLIKSENICKRPSRMSGHIKQANASIYSKEGITANKNKTTLKWYKR